MPTETPEFEFQHTAIESAAPEDEKYLVFTASGDFWLGPTVFTVKKDAQDLADKHPGYIVRPLSEVLAENEAKA